MLNLAYSAKIFAEALSSTDAQQDEWIVRFDVENTENAEITDSRLYTFYLKTSTGEMITNARICVYGADGKYMYLYPDNNGIYVSYLTDNETYNYNILSWDTGIQTDTKSFTVNEQNVSTTVLFYPVTFQLRNPDGSQFGRGSSFIFSSSYSHVYSYNTDENSDPVFFFPSGHYSYQFYLPDSSYPGLLGGNFEVDSSSVVVDYVNQTHKVTFELKDSEGNYLPGGIHIDDPYIYFSSWNPPFSIHLPDGEYNCWLWLLPSYAGINEKLIIAGKDTTIVINQHKMAVNVLNNKNEFVDCSVSMSPETGGTVTVNRTGAGTYTADVLNGKYNLTVANNGSYYPSYRDTVAIQDADTTVSIVLNQFRLNVKTPDGNAVNGVNIYVQNENRDILYSGNGEALLYLADGRYFYTVYSNNNYFTKVDTFELNKEDKEITLLAYPVTFRVTLNNQVPVLNYSLTFNSYGAQPDQKDEYTSRYLLLQGEYDYEVSTNSLLGNYISNKGKVKIDSSKEIPVTFYSAEFSITIDGKPATGSRIRLWQNNLQYYNPVGLSVNEDGKIRDYVSNGLYYYMIDLVNSNNNYSGTFAADSQNVNINVDFYSVRFSIGQSSLFDYCIYIKNADTGEEIWRNSDRSSPVNTFQLTSGHYVYRLYYGYSYSYEKLTLADGEFTIDNQRIDINEYFLPHNFIILNPNNKFINGITIRKEGVIIINTYINNMDTLTYYLPKGEYSYLCYDGLGTNVSGTFKIENSNDTTYILFINTGIPAIKDESDFRIYPNPARDMIWFNLPIDGEISIATMDGKTVFQQMLYQQDCLDISKLNKGIYFVKIGDNLNHKTVLRKLIVK